MPSTSSTFATMFPVFLGALKAEKSDTGGTEGFKMKKVQLLDIAKRLVKMHGLRSKIRIEKVTLYILTT